MPVFIRASRVVRVVPCAVVVFLLAGTIVPLSPARAQGAAAALPRDLADAFAALDDIDELAALNPLKLTPEQLDKMTEAISASQEEYDKKVTALSVAPVQKVAEEIRTVRKKALAGGDVPSDFYDRIKKMREAFWKQRDALNAQTWVGLVAKLKTIWTKDQTATAVRLAKESAQSGKKEGQDDKWLNAYVLNVFISYPRIVPLLKEMKAASSAGTSSADSAAGTDKKP